MINITSIHFIHADLERGPELLSIWAPIEPRNVLLQL